MNSFSKYLFEHLHFGLEEKDFTLIEKIIFFLIILNCVFVVIESEKLLSLIHISEPTRIPPIAIA